MVSVNQVRHFFNLDAYDSIEVKSVKEKGEVTGIFLQCMKDGKVVLTSDTVKKGACKAWATSADAMRKPLKQAVLKLDTAVNGGAPVAGRDYIVDVMISNYICMSNESTLVKFGAVYVTNNMSASDFYLELAKSLARNFSRDVNKFFEIYLDGESTPTEVTATSKHTAPTGGFKGVVLKEVSQEKDYVRGEVPVNTVNFQVLPKTIITDGDDEVNPFTVEDNGSVKITEQTGKFIGNGYEIADTEYFCMGERGDQYRQMGYPRTIRTKYTVDETKEYNVLDINFYFVGRGIDSQKSEKMITVVSTESLEELKSQIETKLGDVETRLALIEEQLKN